MKKAEFLKTTCTKCRCTVTHVKVKGGYRCPVCGNVKKGNK